MTRVGDPCWRVCLHTGTGVHVLLKAFPPLDPVTEPIAFCGEGTRAPRPDPQEKFGGLAGGSM